MRLKSWWRSMEMLEGIFEWKEPNWCNEVKRGLQKIQRCKHVTVISDGYVEPRSTGVWSRLFTFFPPCGMNFYTIHISFLDYWNHLFDFTISSGFTLPKLSFPTQIFAPGSAVKTSLQSWSLTALVSFFNSTLKAWDRSKISAMQFSDTEAVGVKKWVVKKLEDM